MVNLLKDEKSRYLLQHKNNPIDWFPWCERAFKKAENENKPVFLSIGYSSCHWCHVMAHECFENKETAKILNENFVSIKVDKEEYPDVNGFYIDFVANNFGSAGWPLNVFVNHNKVPLFGFMYLPNSQFINLLKRMLDEYHDEKFGGKRIENKFSLKNISYEEAVKLLKSIDLNKDSNLDGPQFPQACLLLYKLENGFNLNEDLSDLLTKGLFDHIEGGWFRYTVDPTWKIPHFEKMLYDQATLLLLCAEVYKRNKNELCKYAIIKTISWLEQHMKLPSGLYGSATDADTKDGEGHYYTIEKIDEIDAIKLFNLDLCGVYENRFVPWINFDFYKKNTEKSNEIIERYKRLRRNLGSPALDKKSVMSWNCFLCYSLFVCAEALDNNLIRKNAIELFEKINKYHVGKNFYHVVYDEKPFQSQEYLEDYSSYLLLLSKVSQKMQPKKVIKLIEDKFFHNDRITNTTSLIFDNINLWQDSPFPSGGSMLLNALLNLEYHINKTLAKTLGIAKLAAAYPYMFGFWLYGFKRMKF